MNKYVYILIVSGILHLCWVANVLGQPKKAFLIPESQKKVIQLLKRADDVIRFNSDSAFKYADLALDQSIRDGYDSGRCAALNILGRGEKLRGSFYQSMQYHFEALKYAENLHSKNLMGYCFLNIGQIYSVEGDNAEALNYFAEAEKIAKEIDDKYLQYLILNSKGKCHLYDGKYDLAEEYLFRTKKYFESIDNQYWLVINHISLAELYKQTEQPQKSIETINLSRKAIDKYGFKVLKAFNEVTCARIYYSLAEYESALKYTEDALLESRNNQHQLVEIEALEIKANTLERMGFDQLALQALQEYIQKKEKLFNEETLRKLAHIEYSYFSEKNESVRLSLEEQNKLDQTIIHRQQTVIALAAVIALLFMILAIIAFRSYRQKNKLNQMIQEQKESAYKRNLKLKDINHEKNNLIRILSHDLRAPINNIKGLAMVYEMNEERKLTETEQHSIDLIKSESDRLLEMISKILNVESLEADERLPEMESICITQTSSDVRSRYKNTAKNKKIKIKLDAPDKQALVLADKIHLQQVIENLLSNALKFSDSGKEVLMKVQIHNGKVQLAIKDQGPGLTEDDKTKIFKKFQTLSAKPTGDEESTGLGLSIVKKYVEEMNGKIWYESVYGQGTTFYIEFNEHKD